jgi:hypothetical protein
MLAGFSKPELVGMRDQLIGMRALTDRHSARLRELGRG